MSVKLTQPYKKHKSNVDKLYSKILNDINEKLYIKILETSQKVNDENIKENSISESIQISLISKSMLEYDKKMFGLVAEKVQMENYFYRPYFLEFFVDMDSLSEDDKNLLTNENNMGKWIEASFREDKWNEKEVVSIGGIIVYSASPFEMNRRKLQIKRNYLVEDISQNFNELIRQQYETTNSIKTNSDIVSLLNQLVGTTSNCNIKIYNVGDGNCIYIYCSNGSRILFDIGQNCNPYSHDWHDCSILRVQSYIGRIKPHNVILSHWDLDHVIGVVFAQQHVFEVPWIAPDLNSIPEKQISMGALRVAKYLELKNKLNLININNKNNCIFSKGCISLWEGKGTLGVAHTSLTETNNSSLVMEITNLNGDLILLPGDCEYLCLPDRLNFITKRYKYLIVPHHCSDMDTTLLNGNSFGQDYAIISAGRYNTERPYKAHLEYLENTCKYTVIKTQDYLIIHIK